MKNFIQDHAIDRDERICFGIVWFPTEKLANQYHEIVCKQGCTYNGGYFHGMACGRDKSFDKYENPRKMSNGKTVTGGDRGRIVAFAVTH